MNELEELSKEIYIGWKVVAQVRETLEGGIPLDPEMIKTWLMAKVSKGELKMEPQEIEELIRRTTEEVYVPEEGEGEEVTKEEVAKRKLKASWCGFKSDANGLYLEARQVHALLKECANTLKLTREHIGLKQVLQHGTYVRPLRIYFRVPSKGELTTVKGVPDGTRESMVQTPRYGTAFKRNDYVSNVRIEFYIYYADVGFLSDKDFKRMMVLAQENGLGANRAEGMGKFDIIELEKIQFGRKSKPE